MFWNILHARVAFEFLPRPTISIFNPNFSFDDRLTWFHLEMKLDSCRYINKNVFWKQIELIGQICQWTTKKIEFL